MRFFYRLFSYFPSKQGKQALDELLHVLSHGGINFDIRPAKDEKGAYFIAESSNLSNKRIVTSGATLAELDQNIKDAIFTAFFIPAYYTKQDLISSPILTQEVKLQYATT